MENNALSQINTLIQRGKYDEARSHLTLLLEQEPDNDELLKFAKMLAGLPANGFDPDGHLPTYIKSAEGIAMSRYVKRQNEKIVFGVVCLAGIQITIFLIEHGYISIAK
jgi:hypothetical protein